MWEPKNQMLGTMEPPLMQLSVKSLKYLKSIILCSKTYLKCNNFPKRCHYKTQWYAYLFTDNHDVFFFFDKRMIWFSGLYC